MARAGILYSHVALAAAKLVAAGKNPTVDTVRVALGGTGSKSTIAPMLKQWKAEHEGVMAAAGTGLPTDLLEAVKGVHDRLQEAARIEVDQVRAEYQQAVLEAARARDTLFAAKTRLTDERNALAAELADIKGVLAQELAARHKDALTITALEAEKIAHAQRLADRAGEIKGLADQLTQTRLQFDHFQDATASQRQEEKQAYEARIARAEQEATTLRAHLQESRETLAALRSEKIQLEHSLAKQLDELRDHHRMLHERGEALAAALEMAGVRQVETEMYAERLDKAEKEQAHLTARLAELKAGGARPRKRANLQLLRRRGSKT